MRCYSLREIQAFLQLGLMREEDVPEHATALLESGLELEPVVWLAGLSRLPNPFEVRDLVARALKQADASQLSDSEAAFIVMRRLSEEITQGAISPEQGARAIWRHLLTRANHPPEVIDFYALSDEYDCGHRSKADLDSETLQAAKDFLRASSDS